MLDYYKRLTHNFTAHPKVDHLQEIAKEKKLIFSFNKTKKAQFGILPRYAKDKLQIKWFELPNFFILQKSFNVNFSPPCVISTVDGHLNNLTATMSYISTTWSSRWTKLLYSEMTYNTNERQGVKTLRQQMLSFQFK